MSKIMVLLPNGYEEIEALTVVDFCRRAEIEVDMVSITDNLETKGDHDIIIKADKLLEDVNLGDYDGVVTPGGYPGTMMLKEDSNVLEVVKMFFDEKKLVASICASPLVLKAARVAEHIEGTIFPGLEEQMNFKKFREEAVVVYNNVITSRGPATATLFAYSIIEYIAGKEMAEKIKEDTLANYIIN
ncbi:MAG: DJ-1/PfpI family protein [Peptostreptococcus sp.]|uniref:DJ-1 family glyoxalase III n=1 Tax=Peptostreptococcus sp. TaxID=1262 RepID=UPI002FC8EE3B